MRATDQLLEVDDEAGSLGHQVPLARPRSRSTANFVDALVAWHPALLPRRRRRSTRFA